jgi:peptidoglycan hydrolase CwlO-like protein
LFNAVDDLSEKDEVIDGEIRDLAHQIAEIIGDVSSDQVSLHELDRRLTIAEDNIADVSADLSEEAEIRL